jgi:hypothetical protein
MKKYVLILLFSPILFADKKTDNLEKRVQTLEEKVEWLKGHADRSQFMIKLFADKFDGKAKLSPEDKKQLEEFSK